MIKYHTLITFSVKFGILLLVLNRYALSKDVFFNLWWQVSAAVHRNFTELFVCELLNIARNLVEVFTNALLCKIFRLDAFCVTHLQLVGRSVFFPILYLYILFICLFIF